MEILTALLGILGVVILAIIVVALRKRDTIGKAINTTMQAKQLQKQLESELYQKEMAKQMPDMVKAKVAKDIEKKLNKKSFVEKLGEASKELTKNAKSGGMQHNGLDSIMGDLNVFSSINKNNLKDADFVRGNQERTKEPFNLGDLDLSNLLQTEDKKNAKTNKKRA
mgnify:CR=1 FL=1